MTTTPTEDDDRTDNNDDAWATWNTERFDRRVTDIIEYNGEIEIAEPEIPRDELVENIKEELNETGAWVRNENDEIEDITAEEIEKIDIENLIENHKHSINPGAFSAEWVYNDGHLHLEVNHPQEWYQFIEEEIIGDEIRSEEYENLGKVIFNALRKTHHNNIHEFNHNLPDRIGQWNIVHKIKDEDW